MKSTYPTRLRSLHTKMYLTLPINTKTYNITNLHVQPQWLGSSKLLISVICYAWNASFWSPFLSLFQSCEMLQTYTQKNSSIWNFIIDGWGIQKLSIFMLLSTSIPSLPFYHTQPHLRPKRWFGKSNHSKNILNLVCS